MAFIVEDGTGIADANSYASVAFADAYFLDRGVVAWAGTQEAKQSALILATDYMEGRYASRYIGYKQYTSTPMQALEFPRLSRDGTTIGMPPALLKACSEYALRALSGPLAPDPTYDASGFEIASTTEKVGPIEETVTYTSTPDKAKTLIRSYPAADLLVRALLKPTSTATIRG